MRREAYGGGNGIPHPGLERLFALAYFVVIVRILGRRVREWNLGVEDANLDGTVVEILGAALRQHATAARRLVLHFSGNLLTASTVQKLVRIRAAPPPHRNRLHPTMCPLLWYICGFTLRASVPVIP